MRAGDVADKKQPRFSKTTSMPALCEAMRKAAFDPRISGLLLNIDLLSIGWAKASAHLHPCAQAPARQTCMIAASKRHSSSLCTLAYALP